MNNNIGKTFYIDQDLQNGFRTHECLSKLAYELKNTTASEITLDFNGVNFIASNLFSVLGCIFSNMLNAILAINPFILVE